MDGKRRGGTVRIAQGAWQDMAGKEDRAGVGCESTAGGRLEGREWKPEGRGAAGKEV